MFKASDIAKESRIIATCAAGPIIEIGFSGKHRDGCGNDLIRYVRQTVRELHPAGGIERRGMPMGKQRA